MTPTAVHTDRDGIALVTLDGPPVNALGAELLAALYATLGSLEINPPQAVVLRGAGGTFCGGADIRGFGKPAHGGPTLRDVVALIERLPMPFVAALEGHALGGGLELALGCDYRVALASARLGTPEIKLGLLPGGGGTQRLPRLIGLEPALAMILGGEPVSAATALASGLVDLVVDGDVAEAAVAFARTLAGKPRRFARTRVVEGQLDVLDVARERAEPDERGGRAARHAIEAVEAALKLPFDAGLRRERELFEELRASEQSKARIHLFFAEREAAKLPGISAPAGAIRTAAVIGGGTMGTGIAMALANASIATTLVEIDPAQRERARDTIAANYAATLKKGRLTRGQMEARLAAIAYDGELEAAAGADLVIEAVFEEMSVKQTVFERLDRIAAPHALLATNTSTLDIDAIARVTARPERVAGLHFFSPANVMRLLEIVRGDATAPETVAACLAFAKQIKKIGVVAGNCDGFIGNRMLAPYKREADFLLEEGATVAQVDRVIRDFGFPMGPFAMFDLAGLDVSWRIRKRRQAEHPPQGRWSKLEDRLCERGRFGQKTQAGFYRYEGSSRAPLHDPRVDDIIAETAAAEGITRRAIPDDEILRRCIYPLINEAAALLAEGIAQRAGDIDVVWVYGYGFPAFRGGPLRYADALGPGRVYQDLLALEAQFGERFAPAPLLRELATTERAFADYENGAARKYSAAIPT